MWPDRPRILLSYAYAAPASKADLAGMRADILIDSGAFTAHTTGKAINIDAYTDWLAERAGTYTAAFALDVIGDPVASLRNYERQRARLPESVTLIPTWHVGSDWSHLESLCSATDYVGIGGLVPLMGRSKLLMQYTVKAHVIARGRGARLHGLGITSYEVVNKLPWRSVDSSSWTYPSRFPLLYLAQRNGAIRSIVRGQKLGHRERALVRRYGINPSVVINPNGTRQSVNPNAPSERRDAYLAAATRSYLVMEDALTQAGRDIRVYLAATPSDAPELTRVHALGNPWAAA
ncbi:Uncharacterised protein [Mycobacteroides abscessus subsp. abscessus]|nr:Uncharacterised protein [Mycobacteroides abscessus subsp. abscessus]